MLARGGDPGWCPAAPVPKSTGNRFFGSLDLLAVDTVEAHHVEAAVIEADEIVAMTVRSGMGPHRR